MVQAHLRARVGIVGAGPAGLLLSHLLHLRGIDSIVLETHSRDYVESRNRAGVLEQNTVDLLTESGVGDRLKKEGLVHDGLEVRFNGRRHRIPVSDLTGGRAVTVYGQREVVRDLIRARLKVGGNIVFGVEDVKVQGLESQHPTIRYRTNGEAQEVRCDFIAGCDGFYGVCRRSIPDGVLSAHERVYPFAWLGILAEVPPSSKDAVYAYHDRGFALHSMRSPRVTRLYLQCSPEDNIEDWSEEQIWEELHTRLATDDDWTLSEGPIFEKGITAMRAFVAEPMQYGRLFLAGDAAHIVPPTGAKGLNLAVADVRVLSEALHAFYEAERTDLLESYSQTCLRRVWRVQRFSWWITSILHRFDGDDEFQKRLQRAELEYICSSQAASRSLAENYVGLQRV